MVFPPVMSSESGSEMSADDESDSSDVSGKSVIPEREAVDYRQRSDGRVVSWYGEEVLFQVDRPLKHWKLRVLLRIRELCYQKGNPQCLRIAHLVEIE